MLALTCLTRTLIDLPDRPAVLDVGCLGLGLYELCRRIRRDASVSGCDIITDQPIPEDMAFRHCDLDAAPRLPFPDDSFDLVVASHLLEHLRDPVAVYGEMARVCKPGGRIYVEVPSDHATWFSFPFRQDWRLILSFYDDPTHTGRPWTPQALYRMSLHYGLVPEVCRYEFSIGSLLMLAPGTVVYLMTRRFDDAVRLWWQATGWACFGVATKPADSRGTQPFRYASFKGRGPGARLKRG
jgi:SAM-dependent methyltransferase